MSVPMMTPQPSSRPPGPRPRSPAVEPTVTTLWRRPATHPHLSRRNCSDFPNRSDSLSLQDSREARRRRHGCRLQSRRHPPQAHCRTQVPSPGTGIPRTRASPLLRSPSYSGCLRVLPVISPAEEPDHHVHHWTTREIRT